MMNEVLMHINYAEQGSSLADAFEWAQKAGFDGVEIRRRDTSERVSDVDYLNRLCEAWERTNLRSLIIGGPPVDLMEDDEGRRAQQLESAMTFYEQARTRLPVVAINLLFGPIHAAGYPLLEWLRHGSAAAQDRHWEQASQGGRQLAACLESIRTPAGVESHMRHLHDTLEASARLIDAIGSPYVGYTIDAGNLLAMPEPPTLGQIMDSQGPRANIVHVKNLIRTFGGEVAMARLKDGDINHRELLARLRGHRFKGPLVIEAPAPGDRLSWAAEDCQYLRSLLQEDDTK